MSLAIYSCINYSFLHLYLQFYYVSVAVTLFRERSTWYVYVVRIIFLGVPVAQQPLGLPSLVLNLLLQLTTVKTVRTACTTVQAVITFNLARPAEYLLWPDHA